MNSSLRKSISLLAALAMPVVAFAQTSLSVNANQTVRTVDERVFGVNSVIWDPKVGSDQTITMVQNAGIRAIRVPGGSLSDEYHWRINKSLENTWRWSASYGNYPDSDPTGGPTGKGFINLITSTNTQPIVTVNYGSGTPEEAAGLVAYLNASVGSSVAIGGTDGTGFAMQDSGYWAALRAAAPLGTDDGMNFLRISRATQVGVKYFEIGNECYGSDWEYDQQIGTAAHDPTTYADRAALYMSKMRAVDPTIKIGVVVVTSSENGSYKNWTPVMLARLKVLNAIPDFIIYHLYAGAPFAESDAGLLQVPDSGAKSWTTIAADLRNQLNTYLTTQAAGVEILVTENNSVYSQPGKQSTSLVNGLYLADSVGNLLQTEINGNMWWGLRNGSPTITDPITKVTTLDGNMSSSLYGGRQYGDYGMLSSPSTLTGETTYYNPYPTYYAMKLLSRFARGGDTVVQATSPNTLLSIFAAKHADGSLALLVINKDPTNSLNANIALTGFTPGTTATTYTYGKPQDTAAQTGSGSTDLATGSMSIGGSTFAASFAPYSLTVIALSGSNGIPIITYQPASRTVNPGVSTTFAVDSSGTPTPTYQWKKNTVAISGATSNTYTIASVSAGDAGNYTVVATNSAGSATSDVATLSVNAAPLVTTQPTAQTVAPGSSAGFTALFSGSPTPTYQWQRLPAGSGTWANLTNGGDYATATTTTLTVTTTVAMDGDQFRCVATNSVGSATSNGVLLTVQGSPGFTTQPAASQAKTVGGSATFTAVVTGTPTPTLQWRKNSVDISGATSATLSLSTLQVGDAATYTLVATNSQGSATSDAAVLTVWPVRPTTFAAQAFLDRYPDLLALYGALPDKLDQAWIYYLNTGIGNGRSDGDFDVAAYLAAYPSVATLFGSDLQGAAAYWYNTGRQLGHRIPTAFPISAYLVRYPAVATLYGTDMYGAWLYYRDQGIYDGEVFDDLFRVEEYLTLYPELFTVFGDDLSGALLHWLTQGSIEGRLGRIPLEFSATGYLDRNPDVAAAVNNDPLLAWSHYWLYGIYEGRYYDDELRVFEYLAVNADLTAAFVADWRAAALHWMRYGRTEGRLGRLPLIFNVTEYLVRSPDVAAVWGTNPTTVFLHYWSYGIDESRTFDDEFRPAEYLALNADLAAVFGTDLRGAFKHWVRYGRSEGRPGKNP